jgi:hypothetical protein
MHFALIATAATAATLCAAGPLPPPNLTPQQIRETEELCGAPGPGYPEYLLNHFPQRLGEDDKTTPPLEEKPELSVRSDDDHIICSKTGQPRLVVPPSGYLEQPGVDAK